ncbi:MAG: DUF1549 domain-containing protein [Verrucomicrobiota bacterium]
MKSLVLIAPLISLLLVPGPALAKERHAPRVPPSQEFRLTADQVANGAAAIDRLVAEGLAADQLQPNAPANDSIFVRRIYLDIAGRIPSAEEAAAFLENDDPDKRAKLIDELLLSPAYRSHTFNWLADMLRHMDGGRTGYYTYDRWLKDQVALNRPWNEFVSDLLTAEGSLASSPATGFLMRDRGMPLDGLSNTLTVFLGANVSCAQCHDHPFADWTQKEFYEMAAFFGATEVSDADPRKVGKRLETEEFSKRMIANVVAPNVAHIETLDDQGLTYPEDYAYGNARPGAEVRPELVIWHKDDLRSDAYKIDNKTPETLRGQFAQWMTHSENPRFALTVANRLWQRAFGIAVKEPIDDLDDLSAASNPNLLAFLGKIMVSAQFDLREFQRVMFNTAAYQAEANPAPHGSEIGSYRFPGPILRRMTAEQAWDSTIVLVEGTAADDYMSDRSAAVTRFRLPGDDLSDDNILEAMEALKSNGTLSMDYRLDAADFLDGKTPSSMSGQMLARASELTQPAAEAHFLRTFGQSARELADDGSREGSIPQLLMLMNGKVQDLLGSRSSRVLSDADSQGDRASQIETLYLHFFSRKPTDAEQARLQEAMDTGTGTRDLAWVLFNTPEFLFVQ